MQRATSLVLAFGLSTGLGLGITGIASAVDSPAPAPPGHAKLLQGQRADSPGRGLGHGPLKAFRHAGGLVTRLSADSITVVGVRGAHTVALDARTTYWSGKDATTRSALRVGQVVRVKLVDPKAAKPVAERVVLVPAHLAGVVTKVDGSTLTVTDPSGFTRFIKGTSTAKVGDVVFATGTVAEDGTTLNATDIRVGAGKAPKKRD